MDIAFLDIHAFDYVENLRNLVGLNCIKEKFCYKKSPVLLFVASRH